MLCVRCSNVRYRPAVSKIESVRPLVVEPFLCLCDVHAGQRRAPLLVPLTRPVGLALSFSIAVAFEACSSSCGALDVHYLASICGDLLRDCVD